ncbi:hypothetical protein HanIR_Chr07g0315511 [Helianthus annuus]|nr:hypothetical protein HanIR_Chr07g0315511 [Helianthus annuus]
MYPSLCSSLSSDSSSSYFALAYNAIISSRLCCSLCLNIMTTLDLASFEGAKSQSCSRRCSLSVFSISSIGNEYSTSCR